MSSQSVGMGRVLSGQSDVIFRPRGLPHCRYMILAFHGATGHATDWVRPQSWPGATKICRSLAKAGAVVIASEWGGDQWGNDTFIGHVETVRALAPNYGCDSSKVVLLGGSMGGGEVWRYIYEHGDKVAGAAMIAPVTDLNALYLANTLGLQAGIASAWGVTAPNPLPAKADPLTNAATISAANVPTTVYYSTADTIIPETSLVAMNDAVDSMDLIQCSTTASHGDEETVAAISLGLPRTLLSYAF